MGQDDALPSFGAPPLNEVVVGVQFASLPDYDFRFVSAVYDELRDEYPHVSEQPYIPPQFEVFGGGMPGFQNRIEFLPAPVQNRTWLSSNSNDHLLQLQSDRFMLNWRAAAVGGGAGYPRFEPILKKFLSDFSGIDELASLKLGTRIQLTQAEVAYINIIPLSDFKDVTNWLSALSSYCDEGLESVSFVTGKVIQDEHGRAIARLHTQAQTVFWGEQGERRGLRLDLTVRGVPSKTDLGALEGFLLQARSTIVCEFARITSASAHDFWKRDA